MPARSLDKPVMEPLGDQALAIVFGSVVDEAVNRRVCALAASIEARQVPGVVDVVPSFATVAVHYLAGLVRCRPGEAAHASMRRQMTALVNAIDRSTSDRDADADNSIDADTHRAAATNEVIDIPVCFGGEDGPDLEEAARRCGLGPDAFLALHQPREPLRVYMLGFAPGAPYIGLFDPRVAVPRRATPRVRVPAGSIGIANRQAVIYPVDGPGGWNLIGRTPMRLFDPGRASPSLLRAGSLVRFKAIDQAGLLAWPTS